MAKQLRWMMLMLLISLTTACGGGGGSSSPPAVDDDDQPGGGGVTVTELTSDSPLTNRSGAEDSLIAYRIVVPANAKTLVIETSGGTGDVDLLVRFGQLPTSLAADCGSFDFGNEELCSISNPAAGQWYILLDGYLAYSGVTLSARVILDEGGNPGPGDGAPGVAVSLSRNSLAMGLGERTSLAVSVERTGGYDGNVVVNIQDMPAWLSYTFQTPQLLPPGQTMATLSLAADTRMTPGNYEFRLVVSGSGVSPVTVAVPVSVPGVQAGKFSASSITVGAGHGCALAADGRAYCWGWNRDGQLGNGTRDLTCSGETACASGYVPTPVAGNLTFSQLSAGGDHTCGLTTSQIAYCWGRNSTGQLGTSAVSIGSGSYSSVPVAVAGGRTYVSIAAGSESTCALTAAGDAYCWGRGASGQLGNGAYGSDSATPVAVVGGHKFVSIDVGASNACGLTAAGAALCWGYGDFGQLGRGDKNSSNVPVAVSGGHVFASLVAAPFRACGVTYAGTAYCWGMNDQAQLGTGATGHLLVPTQVAGGHNFKVLADATGMNHGCGLVQSGAAYCWSNSTSVHLGDLNASRSMVPLQVYGGLSFTQLQSGNRQTCGLTDDGYAYCWGAAGLGIGDNDATALKSYARVPVPVAVPAAQ